MERQYHKGTGYAIDRLQFPLILSGNLCLYKKVCHRNGHTLKLYQLLLKKFIEVLKIVLMVLPCLLQVSDGPALFFSNRPARAWNFIFEIIIMLLIILLHSEPLDFNTPSS